MSVIHLAEGPAFVGGAHESRPPSAGIPTLVGGDFTSPIAALPRRVDLRAYGPRLEDQRATKLCVGEAFTDIMEVPLKRSGHLIELSAVDAYRRFRRKIGIPIEKDDGCSIDAAADVVMQEGIGLDSTLPFSADAVTKEPSPELEAKLDAEASGHKGVLVYAIDDDEAAMWCCAQGFPFIAGVDLPDSVESAQFDGMMWEDGGSKGRHAMSYFGYDMDVKIGPDIGGWIYHQSWGRFGMDDGSGFGYLSFKKAIWSRYTVRRVGA